MHEMGITQGILAASFDAARDAGMTQISEIRISVGELTEVVDFALEFAFEALTPGTMAEGATLVIEKLPARSRCNQCGLEYEHDRFQMVCPNCSSMNVELLQGRELRVDSIEAEADEDESEGAGTEADAASVSADPPAAKKE
jgi:hydrogenase nickel incorporation protein HypA/HybF